MRHTCQYEFWRSVVVDDNWNEGHWETYLCGEPAVNTIERPHGLEWLCAEHYDHTVLIKAIAKEMAQDFRASKLGARA